MSWVTSVMVSVQRQDRDNARAFGDWLWDHSYEYLQRKQWPKALPYPWPEDREWPGPHCGTIAESPDTVWPGTKAPECYVWLGVLDTADLDKVREHFAKIPWCRPNAVQLMLMDQEEAFFGLWMFRGGRLRQYAPERPDED